MSTSVCGGQILWRITGSCELTNMGARLWLTSAKAVVCFLNSWAFSTPTPPVYSYILEITPCLRLKMKSVSHQAHTPSFSQLYVEFVVKNPLCPLGQTVQSELFRSRLDSYVRSLPFFSARAGWNIYLTPQKNLWLPGPISLVTLRALPSTCLRELSPEGLPPTAFKS